MAQRVMVCKVILDGLMICTAHASKCSLIIVPKRNVFCRGEGPVCIIFMQQTSIAHQRGGCYGVMGEAPAALLLLRHTSIFDIISAT